MSSGYKIYKKIKTDYENHLGVIVSSPIFALLSGLSYGVTVALQILVLSVKVRILIAQQKSGSMNRFFVGNAFDLSEV